MTKKIQPNTLYRICKPSIVFKEKYGNANPPILIEDTDVKVFGDSWNKKLNVPAIYSFLERLKKESKTYLIGRPVYYGKINNLGECVFDIELEEITYDKKPKENEYRYTHTPKSASSSSLPS